MMGISKADYDRIDAMLDDARERVGRIHAALDDIKRDLRSV